MQANLVIRYGVQPGWAKKLLNVTFTSFFFMSDLYIIKVIIGL